MFQKDFFVMACSNLDAVRTLDRPFGVVFLHSPSWKPRTGFPWTWIRRPAVLALTSLDWTCFPLSVTAGTLAPTKNSLFAYHFTTCWLIFQTDAAIHALFYCDFFFVYSFGKTLTQYCRSRTIQNARIAAFVRNKSQWSWTVKFSYRRSERVNGFPGKKTCKCSDKYVAVVFLSINNDDFLMWIQTIFTCSIRSNVLANKLRITNPWVHSLLSTIPRATRDPNGPNGRRTRESRPLRCEQMHDPTTNNCLYSRAAVKCVRLVWLVHETKITMKLEVAQSTQLLTTLSRSFTARACMAFKYMQMMRGSTRLICVWNFLINRIWNRGQNEVFIIDCTRFLPCFTNRWNNNLKK
jgi:hypothetical protein